MHTSPAFRYPTCPFSLSSMMKSNPKDDIQSISLVNFEQRLRLLSIPTRHCKRASRCRLRSDRVWCGVGSTTRLAYCTQADQVRCELVSLSSLIEGFRRPST